MNINYLTLTNPARLVPILLLLLVWFKDYLTNRQQYVRIGDIREVKIPRFRFTGRDRHFVYQFLLMSAFLPVISTRFPAVNHGLHVKDKWVRVFSVYYLWAV